DRTRRSDERAVDSGASGTRAWTAHRGSVPQPRARSPAHDGGLSHPRGPDESPRDRTLSVDLPDVLIEISDASSGAEGSPRRTANAPCSERNHHLEGSRAQPGRRAFHLARARGRKDAGERKVVARVPRTTTSSSASRGTRV